MLNPALAFILQKSNGLQKEKTGNIVISENVSGDVPKIGLEPTHLAAPEPKSGVSTNFTTWAKLCVDSLNILVILCLWILRDRCAIRNEKGIICIYLGANLLKRG